MSVYLTIPADNILSKLALAVDLFVDWLNSDRLVPSRAREAKRYVLTKLSFTDSHRNIQVLDKVVAILFNNVRVGWPERMKSDKFKHVYVTCTIASEPQRYARFTSSNGVVMEGRRLRRWVCKRDS